MSRPRPPRPLPAPPPYPPSDEPIARAVRDALWTPARPPPGRPSDLRATLSFLTSTSTVAGAGPGGAEVAAGHSLEVLGWERRARRVYLLDHGLAAPVLFAMTTVGEHAGRAVPRAADAALIARLRAELVPLVPGERAGWELQTRVVQRRGLRIGGLATPVRKFALGLVTTRRERGVVVGQGRTTVTAYLRPRANLDAVWLVPGEALALAVVGFCGVPAGLGFDKQTAILTTPVLQ